MSWRLNGDAPHARHELARWLRAAVLGPRGGGTTRRRASDAFRLGLAVTVVAVSVPVMRANSAAELRIVRAVHPPPAAVSWLVTLAFWLGSAGISVLLVVIGLLVPRLTAFRHMAVAAAATWGVCALLGVLLGPAAGRPPVSELAGLSVGFPVTALAIAVAVAATALPYLSRPLHRLAWLLVAMAALAAVVGGQALPVNAVCSIVLGWGVAAALHLAVGSPLGLPTSAEVTEWIADLHVAVANIAKASRQVWGVEQFTGNDPAGRPVELSVYGRDASDARVLAKLWRFCVYRDSGPTLILDRLQQVEHEAYLTMMAERTGAGVPEVLAAGRFGPSRDAALVTRVPDGPALAQADDTGLDDGALEEILQAVLRLRAARIAHGAIGGDTIIVSDDQGICIRDFRRASTSAPADRLDADLAAALAALAVRAGPERTAAVAARVLNADTARGALVHLQRSALDPATLAALRGKKDLLPRLRKAMADGAGIEMPTLAELKRVSWTNLLFAVGSLLGIWLILGVLSGAGSAMDSITGANWGWVALAFILANLTVLPEAWALMGAAVGDLPFGRCVALELSNDFTVLVGRNVAVFALRVRFFQRQGYDVTAAVTAGALTSTAWWVVRCVLFVLALPFSAGTFRAPSGSGNPKEKAIWIILAVIIAAGIAATLIFLVPRLRRLASRKVRPHLVTIWARAKAVAAEPRKIVYVVVGAVVSQLLTAMALGAALHAVGEQAGIATLITVITLAGIIGGAVPVPGGAGVVEAGLIAGLTSAGVAEGPAVAAVLIQRLFTAYLPPIWGWFALAWMRRREYV